MHKVIVESMNRIKDICQKHKVKKMSVFGSICTNKFNSKSDVDILVDFEEMDCVAYADNYFDTIEELENVFKRKVDLITEKTLSNPYFINSIKSNIQQIYG